MGSKGVAIGVPLISGIPSLCTSCYEGKQSHHPAPKEATRRAAKTLALIHSDLCGMIQPRSLAGSHYFITFTDDYSRYTWIFFMRKKSDSLGCFQKFKATVELAFPGLLIQAFRSDRGGEYISTAFTEFLQASGIHRELTQAYTPHQNGVSERKNRTLLEKARSMFLEAHTPRFLWAEAVNTANYLTNRSPTRANSGISPYQRLYKRPPALHHLRIFGCLAFVHIPDESRTKLEPKSHKCIMIGYSEDTKGYRCYNLVTHKIHVSGDVHFMEHRFWHSPDDSLAPTTSVALEPLFDNSAAIQVFDPILQPAASPPLEPVAPTDPAPMQEPPFDPVPDPSSSTSPADPASSPPLRVYVRRQNLVPPSTSSPTVPSSSTPAVLTRPSCPALDPPPRRSSRTHIPNSWFLDYVANVTYVTDAEACVQSMGEPRSYAQAATDPHWIAAMADELNSIRANQTWILVPCPSDIKPLHVKWVYKLKIDTDGRPLRYKARLVARGDEQLAGVDFTETFSPVVKWSTMRTVVSMAAMHGWPILHLDVKYAFLNGDLTERVYIFQPPGFIQPGAEDHICLLNKALYGLRQSPRQWNARLDAYLTALGLNQSHADPSLYTFIEGDLLLILIIYVDDLLIIGSHATKVRWLEAALSSEFKMSLLGPLAVYLGVSFFYEPAGILMSHTRYIQRCLNELGLTDCLPAAVPIDPSVKLSENMDSSFLSDPTYYHIIVGKALHLNNTRPDIVFAVGVVTRFTKAPREAHLEAAIHIMRYLKGTMLLSILYRRGETVIPSGYTNSDFQGDHDARRSTSGYLFNIGSGPTSWRSKLQDEIAESSSEAEYRACAEALKEALWLRNFFEDIGMALTKPLIIYCDNQSCIALAKNPVQHARTKHLERQCHFTRHQIKQGRIELVYVRSKDQLADINTKALPKPRFLELRDTLHLTTLEEVRRRNILLLT
jgi:transposase InsO family protein